MKIQLDSEEIVELSRVVNSGGLDPKGLPKNRVYILNLLEKTGLIIPVGAYPKVELMISGFGKDILKQHLSGSYAEVKYIGT